MEKLPIESLIKLKMYLGKMGRSRGKDVKGKSELINICKTSLLRYLGILFGILLETLVDQLLNFCLLRSDPRSGLWSGGLVIITCLGPFDIPQ